MGTYDSASNAPEKKEKEGQGTEPSGPKGDNPATRGPGSTELHSGTPENKEGHINPSAPGNAGVTPGTTGEK